MFVNILLGLLGLFVFLLVVLLFYAATKPDAFRIERGTTIKAPPPSADAASAAPPVDVIASTTSDSGSTRRPVTATAAPAAAYVRATAAPMPVPPPVTRATFPRSSVTGHPSSSKLLTYRRCRDSCV